MRQHCLVVLVAIRMASCRTLEPSPGVTPPAISAFTTLKGGSAMAIAPGEPLVALHAQVATWWERDAPIEVELPSIPVDGGRWLRDGKRLRVGLGTLDVATRTWQTEAALQRWQRRDKSVSAVAWFADDAHVAIEIGPPVQPIDRPTVAPSLELVIARIADGEPRARIAIDPGITAKLAAAEDRVMIAGIGTRIVDLDAKPIAGPAGLPDSPSRVAFAAGMFAVTGHAGEVTLIRASDGHVLASWRGESPVVDAVPIAHGMLSLDMTGTVRVGCLEHDALKIVAEARASSSGMLIQLVGSRVVISDGGADPIRWATFANPCR